MECSKLQSDIQPQEKFHCVFLLDFVRHIIPENNTLALQSGLIQVIAFQQYLNSWTTIFKDETHEE